MNKLSAIRQIVALICATLHGFRCSLVQGASSSSMMALPQSQAAEQQELQHELCMIIQKHVLPHVPVTTFARLSCCSTALRQAISEAPDHIWRSAASAKLGPAHPALTCSRSSILAALQRQHARHAAICSMQLQDHQQARLPGAACSCSTLLQVSPNARFVAATFCARQRHHALVITDLSVHSSQGFEQLSGILELQWWADSEHISTLHSHSVEISQILVAAEGGMQLLSVRCCAFSQLLDPHNSSLHLAPGGRHAAVSSRDYNLICISPLSAEETEKKAFHCSIGETGSWLWSPEGSYIVLLHAVPQHIASENSSAFLIRVIDAHSHRQVHRSFVWAQQAELMSWHPAGKQLALCGCDDAACAIVVLTVCRCQPSLPMLIRIEGISLEEASHVHVAWNPVASELAVMTRWRIQIHDSTTGWLLRQWSSRKSGSWFQWQSGLAWSPDGCFLALGSSDSAICVLDARTGDMLLSLAEPHANVPVRNLQFAADGSAVLWSGYWWYRFPQTEAMQLSWQCRLPSSFVFAKMLAFEAGTEA